MAERGEFRGIMVVIIDGPDFQELTPNARLLLFVLKLKLGPSGIGVIPAMIPALEEHTGLDTMQVQLALEVLQHAGWVRVERNIVWIIEGLKNEPSLLCANLNHRKSILAHLAGLPRLAIVEAYRRHYAAWLRGEKESDVDPIAIPSRSHVDGILDPIAIPSRSRKTEDGRRKTDTENGNGKHDGTRDERAAAADAAPRQESLPEWVAEGVAWWSECVGRITPTRFLRAFGPSVKVHGWPKVFPALQHFVTHQRSRKGGLNPDWFVREDARWIAEAADASRIIGANGNEAELARELGVAYHGAPT